MLFCCNVQDSMSPWLELPLTGRRHHLLHQLQRQRQPNCSPPLLKLLLPSQARSLSNFRRQPLLKNRLDLLGAKGLLTYHLASLGLLLQHTCLQTLLHQARPQRQHQVGMLLLLAVTQL